MVKTGIYIKTEQTELHIPIYDKITVITGDSATGKTKMMRFLKACKNARKNNVKIESSIDMDDILLVTDEDMLKMIIRTNEHEKIIFIDRFNNVYSEELLTFMNDSKNIFIIYNRYKHLLTRPGEPYTDEQPLLRAQHRARAKCVRRP